MASEEGVSSKLSPRMRELLSTVEGRKGVAEGMTQPRRCGGLDYVDGVAIYQHEKRIALEMMEKLKTQSEYQYIVENDDYFYKPIYRAISLMIPPGGLYPEAARDRIEAILRVSHPYFVKAIDQDREAFDQTYDFVWGAWF